jgi:hypothetical protein
MHEPIDAEKQWWISYTQQLPRPQDLPDLPEDHPLALEWKTYKREIGRLLAEGNVGRHALIKGDKVVSVWDTHGDAYQAGRERFGLGVFMVQEVQPVDRPVRIGYYLRCRSNSVSP